MISVVVLTKNEEKNIVDCLESLTWCDEVIVIDDQSEDRTAEISQKLGAKVYKHNLNGDFSKQRNFGLEKARGEWILFIDADERISEQLKNEILYKTSIKNSKVSGYFLKRKDIMWGKELRHGETGNIKLLRMARKEEGEWEGKVHEEWKILGQVAELNNTIIHFPHQTVAEFLKEINFYTTIRVKELYAQGVKVHWLSIILYPKGKFLLNYFIKLGFLDGTAGLVFAILMSFHSFLVRGKLWLLWQKK